MTQTAEDFDELNQIFVGTGEMAELMREHNWSETSLGDPRRWPQALKAAVGILLTSRFEMWVGWGPEVAFLYNDAYRPTLGQKHPRSLGMPTKELWAEIWEEIRPRLRIVYEKGEATWDRALLLILQRAGYAEETYHTFSYSPLIGDAGKVEGVFCAVSEETERIISERRLASLKALATELAEANTVSEVFQAAAAATRQADRDMLFSAAYAFDDEGNPRPMFDELGGPDANACADLFKLRELWNDRSPFLTLDLPEEVRFRSGAWDAPAQRVAVIALPRQGSTHSAGALVIGLNPFRPFDDDYRSFLRLFAGQVAARKDSARALESERRRAGALNEALLLRKEAADVLARANKHLTNEVEVRTQELDRMRAMFAQAPSFMALFTGPNHIFELANDAYRKLVGHRDLIGLSVRDALPEVKGQGYFELLDEVYRTGKPFVGEALRVLLQRSPGAEPEERFVHLVYQPLMVGNSVQAIFVDGYDVTHQKNAEDALRLLNNTLEARVTEAMERLKHETEERTRVERALQQSQKMEALGALTGGVAHDFNNLLQVISSNLHLLARMTPDNPAAQKRIDSALTGVARGAKLASQLLSFGRRQPLEPKVVNVGRFVRGMEDLVRRAIGEGIELEAVISGGLWNSFIDPGQVENAVLNLAINARDAMNGHGRLTIEAGNAHLDDTYSLKHDDVRPGQYVMIAVTDTGTGMTQDVIRRAFEPFFSTKPEGKGTGLGLSMVYGFVKQSGGHVMIYSEVGEGTTVKLYLPRSMEQEDLIIVPASGEQVQGGTETILVVEDDEDVREATVATLSELGYRVLRAKDADGALTVIDSGIQIDLLFTDVVMPGKLRSPELARKARMRLPNVAVLFTSGYTENSIVHGGRLDAGVELLSKPYSREVLARRVRHVIGNQAQRNAIVAAAAEVGGDLARSAQGMPGIKLNAVKPGWRILLVEDDDLIRSTTTAELQAEGHQVTEVGRAKDALDLLGGQKFDVMVADVGLPDMPGTECARAALAVQPDLAIVFASGAKADLGEFPSGRCEVVLKPYSLGLLLEACTSAMGSTSGGVREATERD